MCAADTPPVSARERFGHDVIVSDRAPSNRGTPMIDRNSRPVHPGRPVGSQPGGLVKSVGSRVPTLFTVLRRRTAAEVLVRIGVIASIAHRPHRGATGRGSRSPPH